MQPLSAAHTFGLCLAFLAACIPARAQALPPVAPAYDIISVHQNKSGSGASSMRPDKASYTATNVTLATFLYYAYSIKEDQTSGLSGPVASARFDIVAKISDPPPEIKLTLPQRRAMMAALLSERFKLSAHIEPKILPIFELIVHPGGPKFRPAPEGPPSGTSFSRSSFSGHAATIANLVDSLSVDRPIVDKTGLTGKYDLTLKWNPEDNPDPQSQNPSIFTALQEQLGLKLRPAKGPVNTLVVDHVEMPTEN